MNFTFFPVEVYAECAAPFFAFLLEILPFPSDRQLDTNADNFVRRRGISGQNAQEEVRRFSKGTLSLGSVSPTLIAVVATIASFHDLKVLLGSMFGILLALLVVNAVVGGRSPEDYESVIIVRGPNQSPLWAKITPARLISWAICAINILLIVLILVYGSHEVTSRNPNVPVAPPTSESAPKQPAQHNTDSPKS